MRPTIKRTIVHGTDVVEVREIEISWHELRMMRDEELEQTDWWAVKDLTMSQAKKDHRQTLRDLPQSWPDATTAAKNWPVMPDE